MLNQRPGAASRWSASWTCYRLEHGERQPRSPRYPSSAMSLPPAIPWRVALQQSSPPLHRLDPSCSKPDFETINLQRTVGVQSLPCLTDRDHLSNCHAVCGQPVGFTPRSFAGMPFSAESRSACAWPPRSNSTRCWRRASVCFIVPCYFDATGLAAGLADVTVFAGFGVQKSGSTAAKSFDT